MCEHEFDGFMETKICNGIVFVIYQCNKCGEEFDQTIGETWSPNEKGVFDY